MSVARMQDNGRNPQPTPIMDCKNHTRVQAAHSETLPFALCSSDLKIMQHGNKPERLVRERTSFGRKVYNSRLATIYDEYLVAVHHYVSNFPGAKPPLQAESLQPCRLKKERDGGPDRPSMLLAYRLTQDSTFMHTMSLKRQCNRASIKIQAMKRKATSTNWQVLCPN